MVYQFKDAARVPSGVTADGVMQERDRVVQEYGKASVKLATTAVLSKPEDYPNLRAFGPRDAEQAFEQAIEHGVRYAFGNIIHVRVETDSNPDSPPRQIRVLHAVPDKEGDIVFETLQVIAKVKSQRDHLLTQLNKDVDVLAAKLKDVIAELSEIS